MSISAKVRRMQRIFFHHGHIYTLYSRQPFARWMAVEEGRIVAMGLDDFDSRQFPEGRWEHHHLQEQFIYPGLIESHSHLLSTGGMQQQVMLHDCKSEAECVERVVQWVNERKIAAGTWVLGFGWNQFDWDTKSFPTSNLLSVRLPHHPVALTRIDAHALWVNHHPETVYVDHAMNPILASIPSPDKKAQLEALRLALRECSRQGITCFQDAGSSLQDLALYQSEWENGEWPLRLYVMMNGMHRKEREEILERGVSVLGDDAITVRSIKLFADGALGSCGAHLFSPYQHHEHTGLELLSQEELIEIASEALAQNFQVCTHAIGDRANHQVLNAYEAVSSPKHRHHHRLRIEHAELLSPEDLPRFARLSVIASMQPTHLTSDRHWLNDSIGEERTFERTSLWKSLLQQGVVVCSGSDAPIEPLNPFWGLYALLTRSSHARWPPGGHHPSENLALFEALQTYTTHGAYAAFLENKIGNLRVGFSADFFTLEKDLFAMAPQELITVKVQSTYFKGELVSRSDG